MIDHKGTEVNAGPNIGLHRLAILLSCMTIVLLGAGALVTSNEAGDSVPDWPFSFGRWLISSNHFVANVRFEYSHRVIAGVVGLTTLLVAVWAQLSERRSSVRKLGWIAFAGVLAQAGIGGVRVLFPEYKALIAVPHALVAQSFFAVVVTLVVITSRSWSSAHAMKPDVDGIPIRKLVSAGLGAVLIQLVLGAGFRHQAFGIIPHIVGAVAVTVLIVSTVVAVMRRHGDDNYLAGPVKAAFGLLVVQLCLGVAAYIARLASASDPQPLEPMISLTVAHLVVGALTLAAMVVLALRSFQVLAPSREQSIDSVGERGLHSSARGAAV
ncbi:MAG TPA: COX15/CtaA family protein [Blastocatellia bacterium]|nr:COX15/CtaA family protein [Blastocatellia bacterium]